MRRLINRLICWYEGHAKPPEKPWKFSYTYTRIPESIPPPLGQKITRKIYRVDETPEPQPVVYCSRCGRIIK